MHDNLQRKMANKWVNCVRARCALSSSLFVLRSSTDVPLISRQTQNCISILSSILTWRSQSKWLPLCKKWEMMEKRWKFASFFPFRFFLFSFFCRILLPFLGYLAVKRTAHFNRIKKVFSTGDGFGSRFVYWEICMWHKRMPTNSTEIRCCCSVRFDSRCIFRRFWQCKKLDFFCFRFHISILFTFTEGVTHARVSFVASMAIALSTSSIRFMLSSDKRNRTIEDANERNRASKCDGRVKIYVTRCCSAGKRRKPFPRGGRFSFRIFLSLWFLFTVCCWTDESKMVALRFRRLSRPCIYSKKRMRMMAPVFRCRPQFFACENGIADDSWNNRF